MLQLIYKKAAVKELAKMPAPVRRKMQEELATIAANPHGYSGDWKPLTGSPYWRLRVGGYRAICHIQDEALVLLVLKAGPRGDIYK
ncbi:MAG: type II toxin-antitoxin system RelE/ParE family toxin [Pseudomonadota bacterium]